VVLARRHQLDTIDANHVLPVVPEERQNGAVRSRRFVETLELLHVVVVSLTLAGCARPGPAGTLRHGQRIDCDDDPLGPRATRHDHELLPVRVDVVIRMVGTGVPCREDRRVVQYPRAVLQIDAGGDESVVVPVE
jgi:hypothetical protein